MSTGDITDGNTGTRPERAQLSPEQFLWDSDLRIFLHPQQQDFAYSDGEEVEQRIYAGLKLVRDRSTASVELRDLITDWPTEYHFTNLRHNLPRHIVFRPEEQILEIGAGCGAL